MNENLDNKLKELGLTRGSEWTKVPLLPTEKYPEPGSMLVACTMNSKTEPRMVLTNPGNTTTGGLLIMAPVGIAGIPLQEEPKIPDSVNPVAYEKIRALKVLSGMPEIQASYAAIAECLQRRVDEVTMILHTVIQEYGEQVSPTKKTLELILWDIPKDGQLEMHAHHGELILSFDEGNTNNG